MNILVIGGLLPDDQSNRTILQSTITELGAQIARTRHVQPQELPTAVSIDVVDNIHRVTLFIAIWCREYACSPWCHDELELALDRHKSNALGIALPLRRRYENSTP